MNKTNIEWALNPDGTPGHTWNPITGCLNGCEYCYARRLANTRLKERYLGHGELYMKGLVDLDPFYPRFWEDKLYHPWGGKPKGIFPCDMSDLFGIGIPQEWTEKVLNLCRLHEQNRYYLLTKQPQNLIKFSPFPDNCWVGVSATSHEQWKEAGKGLRQIEASVKYFSFEPLLHRVGVSFYDFDDDIKWVIIGAQTKPYKPPDVRWVQEIIVACREAGIPYFLKENLRKCLPIEAPFYRMPGYRIQREGFSYITDKPVLTQEMPKEVRNG